MKKGLIIAVIVFVVLIAVAVSGVLLIRSGIEEGSKLVINDIDLSAVKDGTYIGKYEAGRWTNEVSVTVKDHKIISIDIIKDVLISKPEVSEDLTAKVIERQNTNVDIVSGATVTSKAYLKAIENALSE